MPLVSICIPAYQAEIYLPEALASVRTQSFTDWELIVTEDGSHDAAEALVADFARSVSQPVRFERHTQNKGLPATRNSGIGTATGAYIALLDADDYWDSKHLQTAVAIITETGASLAHAGSVLFDSESGNTLGIRAPSTGAIESFPQSLFLAEYIIQPSSVVLARTLWDRVGGFNETYRYVEDREMWLRCARAGARFAFTGQNTCYYRKHPAALSTHAAEMAIASARVFEQHLDWSQIPAQLRMQQAASAWVAAARILQRTEPSRSSAMLLRAQQIVPSFERYFWAAALRLYSYALKR
jgi:glycosyltransferase involved in cell wall biosynthesis